MKTFRIFVVAVVQREIHREKNRDVTTTVDVIYELKLILLFKVDYLEFTMSQLIGVHGLDSAYAILYLVES
jgi:hypothetical protein